MAYMNQQKKAELAPSIKAVLKKYGVKGSIAVRNHMVLVVTVKSGKLDILGNWFENGKNNPQYSDRIVKKPESLQVNPYHIESQYSDKVKDFLLELLSAMKGKDWYNNSDVMTDYFDTAYYMDINVGSWDKPYTIEA